MTVYADIADFDEDSRIDMIGHQAMDHQRTVGFFVDAQEAGKPKGSKADRYIRKLQDKFPGIRIIGRCAGPVADTEMVKVGPPLN